MVILIGNEFASTVSSRGHCGVGDIGFMGVVNYACYRAVGSTGLPTGR